jgi:hypothetical protein
MDLNKFANYLLKYDGYNPEFIVIKPINSGNKEEIDYHTYTLVGILMDGIKYRIGWSINNTFIPNVKANSFKLKNKINKSLIKFVKKKNKIKRIHKLLIILNNWGLNNDVGSNIIKFVI